jgi:hypothetical protein
MMKAMRSRMRRVLAERVINSDGDIGFTSSW